MKTVYLFFNYSHADSVPKHDYWLNFKNPDSTKLAWFCAESWRRHGWDVKRMTTQGVKGFDPFKGQLIESQKIYALEFFNFWFKAKSLAPAWFTTIDVFNYSLSPDDAHVLESLAHDIGKSCVSVQAQHFSASCLWITREFCDLAINAVLAYDAGFLAALPNNLVSDETIVREYLKDHYLCPPLARYGYAEQGWQDATLIHLPRSVLTWFAEQYPAV